MLRQTAEPQRRLVEATAQREEERRCVALAEHPGGEYLGGGLVRLPDGRVARSSAAASNDELMSGIRLASDTAVEGLLSQGRSLRSLIGDGVVDEFVANERRLEGSKTSTRW